jgi:F-type H+-transporting ATPase subunit b
MILSRGGKGKIALTIGLTLLGLFLIYGLGFGSEGGGNGDAHDSGRLLDLGYRFLNFILLVIILFIVAKKSGIKDFFSGRREDIGKKFEDLKKERDAAKGRYHELENELKAFETKKEEIIGQFRNEGIAEKERIIAEAENRAKQMLKQTDLTIQREIETAKERLRAEMVEIAAQRAQQIIEKQIKDSDQDQLVNEFIERVEKLH